jgi:predicted GNAT superfamily acetyltransferase
VRKGFEVRELRKPEEFRETEAISKAAWRFTERSVSPAPDLIAATHSGGLTAGAFLDGRMLGFVHGIPRTNAGQPCQHSHLLAVLPEAQGKGLAVLLKLFQREWCLQRGIRLVTWTYDPFLMKNARLNIGRLRATARKLIPNFYGALGGIYGELPTDRFEVVWRLDDPIVERAARGEATVHSLEDDEVPLARARGVVVAPRVAVPFPAGAPGIFRTDPAGSLAARRAFARLVVPLFEKGYEATALNVRGEGPAYILERR